MPVFSNVPSVFYVPAGASGNVIGVSTYVSDEDIALSPPIPGEKLLYSLTAGLPFGNPSSTFAINSTTGQIYVLNVTAFRSAYNVVTDRGLNYSLSITACDAGIDGPILCTSIIANITAISGAIPPVVFEMMASTITENAQLATPITRVNAYDEAGFTMTYLISSGNVDDVFNLNNKTGWITLGKAGVLNYGTRKTYSLVITVSNIFASSTVSLTINIIEVNKAPSLPDVQSFSINTGRRK